MIRCEREDKSTKDPGPRLLVVDDRALSIYLEYPEYFGLPPWVDVTGSDSFDQPNGLEMLRLDVAVELDDLDSLDLLMSAEPQVREGQGLWEGREGGGSEEEGREGGRE